MAKSRSLRRPRPSPEAEIQLLCLPHAGGSHSLYTTWAELLPPEVELILACYPGRLDRIGDPWPAGIPELAEDIAAELGGLLDRPWAVFGHSMGALVGYELVVRMQNAGKSTPSRFFASAREAPDHPPVRNLHVKTDDDICAELIELGGTDPELLRMPEMRELILPVVRGDYRLLAEYGPRPGGRLACPVTAFIGRADSGLSREGVECWSDWTAGSFDVVQFPGDHFYLSDDPARLIGEVIERLPARV
ncbi:thioesterase II family protein [Streptomyces sp. NPDC086549]|uniref:thioesterase II family protein n=1 Tax=Streptomyces sp. NPDC086549 TaxID=3365752 RepID=UPI0038281949